MVRIPSLVSKGLILNKQSRRECTSKALQLVLNLEANLKRQLHVFIEQMNQRADITF